ncbi:MAG: GNAT family N-acetyltransferase [Candidatus Cloacimonetes bacterium]|nr:GNAT family N-acetyltransferase [Candidatus Cloacimonadota bacterium]
MKKIIGNQIVLRDWKEKDIEEYYHWNSGKFLWLDFDGPYYPSISKTELEKRINFLKSQMREKSFPEIRKRIVIVRPKSDRLIGILSRYWINKETFWLAAGISIYDDSYWNNGIGFEALGLWIQYLFDNFSEIVRLDLKTWSGNLGMMKLAEKLGFTLEARFRKARIVDGIYYDSIGYGILREEWNKFYPIGFKRFLNKK